MLIIGAKGFAKEVLEVCHENNELTNLAFYDDINTSLMSKLFNEFPIIKSIDEAKNYFETIDNNFSLGLGDPKLREQLYLKFLKLGGCFKSVISMSAKIGHYNVNIGKGSNILQNAIVSNDVTIGKGCLIYYNSTIAHDVVLGDFVEVSPHVSILGRTRVGNHTSVGSHSVILPDLKIGKNVIIGAGSVVTKDIPDNCTVFGVPAVVKKKG